MDAAAPAAAASAPAAAAAAAAAAADVRIVFPPGLTPRQRAALHAAAESYGLVHESTGEGDQRRIALGPEDAATQVEADAGGSGGREAPLTDGKLCALLQRHLRVDAAPHFADVGKPAAAGKSGAARAAARAAGFGAGGRSALASAPVSLEEFVERTSRLLELEREADIQQATEATSLYSPERAQVRVSGGGGRSRDSSGALILR